MLLPKESVALVTGAEQGIGRALAIGLARAGANVVVNYLEDLTKATAVCNEIESHGCSSMAIRADVSQPKAVHSMFQMIKKRFGRIDMLVNNAGIHLYRPFTEMTEKEWDRQIAVDLKGAYLCARKAAEIMIKQKSGRIINITSNASLLAYRWSAAYNSAKGGLLLFTRQLALELGPHNITVNAVSPGATITPHNMFILKNKKAREGWNRIIPLGRWAKPEEIAGAVVFLCSKEASYITGQQIAVDGGVGICHPWPDVQPKQKK